MLKTTAVYPSHN